jgi:hypothetical protein
MAVPIANWWYRYASPLYVDMSKRTQIATPYDPNNPNRNPNDLFQDENGSEHPPMTKVFIGKVNCHLIMVRVSSLTSI